MMFPARSLVLGRVLARGSPAPAREYVVLRPCVVTRLQSIQSASLLQLPRRRLYSSTHQTPPPSSSSSTHPSSRPPAPKSTSATAPRATTEPGPTNTTTDNNPGQLPSFSLNDLGATPRIRIFIYVVVGILATVETYTYSIWIWQKWFKKDPPQEEA